VCGGCHWLEVVLVVFGNYGWWLVVVLVELRGDSYKQFW